MQGAAVQSRLLQEGFPDPSHRLGWCPEPLEGLGPFALESPSALDQARPVLTGRAGDWAAGGWRRSLAPVRSGAGLALAVLGSICRKHAGPSGEVSRSVSSPRPELPARLLSPDCPRNRFGESCEHTCACRNGGLCHPASGSCSCRLGWTGPHCELGECSGGWGRPGGWLLVARIRPAPQGPPLCPQASEAGGRPAALPSLPRRTLWGRLPPGVLLPPQQHLRGQHGRLPLPPRLLRPGLRAR